MPFNHIGKLFSRSDVSACLQSETDHGVFFGSSKIGLALVLIVTFWCQAATAEALSPKLWLEKMSAAMQELNYQGTFIYRRDEDLAAMKVRHVVDEQGARELIETLTGEFRKELRNSPHASRSAEEGLASTSPQLRQIENYYALKLLGSDRAAGRETQLISVSPKDEYRYGYRLWLDQATGLLLKSDLLDQQGKILEQVMFTSLELIEPEKNIESLSSAEPESVHRMSPHSKNKSNTSRLLVDDLPEGFELIESQTGAGHGDVEHMVYSDGLASVSVFVEQSKPEGEAFVGLSRMGAVNAFGAVHNGNQITVVGDVPEITVKTIGQSIRLKGAAQ